MMAMVKAAGQNVPTKEAIVCVLVALSALAPSGTLPQLIMDVPLTGSSQPCIKVVSQTFLLSHVLVERFTILKARTRQYCALRIRLGGIQTPAKQRFANAIAD
jgi:hypothetical protein